MGRTRVFAVIFYSMVFFLGISCSRSKEEFCEKDQIIVWKVDSILSLMTLEEKIGQMSVISGVLENTGPMNDGHFYIEEVRNGRVGAMLNISGVEDTRKLQEITLTDTRLGIPLLFGLDVIHGYATIFPVPLAEACSWDLEAIESSARVAGAEASAAGIQWTYAPMVDIARDPRWGRIMEGAGEDPYLASLIAAARVKGFQGNDLAAVNTVAACAKHFAAYGAAEGGRDYNTTDLSERTLREIYLPPFKAAADAGVATFMTAFNDLNGNPASGNQRLNFILRKEWQYKGMVVSDWDAIGELIIHGVAKDKEEAAILSMRGGIDMDMQGYVYGQILIKLVKEGKISQSKIDDAVRKILQLKFQLGLFDDPYRYCNVQREMEELLSDSNRSIAREVAKKSIVLLKNENHLLPLSKDIKCIAVIGPLADNSEDILGNWKGMGKAKDAISLLQGLRQKVNPKTKILFEKGCEIDSMNETGFKSALAITKKADVVLLAMGEAAYMSGEAGCRSFLGLPGAQLDLIKEIYKTGKPIILVLMNGRPLAIPWENEHLDAIVEAWFPGTEGGNAIADVLFGDYNPSGKLVVTFPYSTGQIPVYYNHKNTGQPADKNDWFTSKYLDAPFDALYPFGFGLSYTTFEYSGLKLSAEKLHMDDTLTVSTHVTNTGNFDGEEIVQLYLRDWYATVTRPVKELKGYRKVFLKTGETAVINFMITKDMISFYDENMHWCTQPGEFSVMVGSSSASYLEKKFIMQ
jgi:beta-glucosidase